MSLENILSVRAYQCLIRHNIKTIEDLSKADINEIKNFKNIGDRAFFEVATLKEKLGNKMT